MSESPLALTFGARNSAFLQSSEDFRKQRVKVTRRIHKLKRYLKIQIKDTKNYKSKKITSDDYSSDNKYYLLSILEAERDYLYALEIKALLDLNSSTNAQSKQKLLSTRLRKSLKISQNLVEISQNESDETKRLEILVYKELLQAYLAIVSKKWKVAISSYSLARIGLKFLEKHGDIAENKILYKDIIEETIDEPFKLATYRDSKSISIDLNEYSKIIANESAKNSETFKFIDAKDSSFLKADEEAELIKEIDWRSYTARVKDETTSRLLSRAQNVKFDDLESYDNALILWQEALENHSSFIAKADQNDDEEQDDQILLAYIKYSSLITRLRRDQTLLSGNKKESLRILDTIITTINEIKELPGVYSDDELFQNLELLSQYYQGLKLKMIGQIYFDDKSYNESLLLCTKSLESLKDSEFTVEFEFISNQDLQTLQSDILTLKQNSHVLAQIEQGLSKDKSVADDVYKFSNDYKNIVNFQIEAAPVKPVLFDVAFNYISYNKSDTKTQFQKQTTQEKAPASKEQTENKKKGFFGIFGR